MLTECLSGKWFLTIRCLVNTTVNGQTRLHVDQMSVSLMVFGQKMFGQHNSCLVGETVLVECLLGKWFLTIRCLVNTTINGQMRLNVDQMSVGQEVFDQKDVWADQKKKN